MWTIVIIGGTCCRKQKRLRDLVTKQIVKKTLGAAALICAEVNMKLIVYFVPEPGSCICL